MTFVYFAHCCIPSTNISVWQMVDASMIAGEMTREVLKIFQGSQIEVKLSKQ